MDSRAGRIGFWITAVLVVGAAVAFFVHGRQCIRAQSPYPTHTDEPFILDPAWAIASSGELNPHFFNYGSLPIYISAASLRAGVFIAERRGKIKTMADVDPVSFPYYGQPVVAQIPRVVFLIFACVALCAVALTGYALRARLDSALPCTLALMLDPLFQEHAKDYVNVDILVAALATSALAFLAWNLERNSLWIRCIVPGLFAGAAIATKYTAGLLVLPFAFAILRGGESRRLAKLALLALATTATFLLCQPYAALSFTEFWEAVQVERVHYQTGHPGWDGEPGLDQALYYARDLYRRWGPLLLALIGLGIVDGLRKRRTLTLLLLIYPLTLFAFMCTQRVHFSRNLLPAAAVLTSFCGPGLVAAFHAMGRLLSKIHPRMRELWTRVPPPVWSLGALFSLMLVVPLARAGGSFEVSAPESRKLVARYVREHRGRSGCTLLAPRELGISPTSVGPDCELRTFSVRHRNPVDVARKLVSLPVAKNAYLAVPHWNVSATGEQPLHSADEWNALPTLLGLEQRVLHVGRVSVRLNRRRVAGDPRLDLYRFAPRSIAPPESLIPAALQGAP